MKPTITFAIPFYDGIEYLRIALESALEQRHVGWHLLVIDDSGRDSGAEEVVRSYADHRMEYRRNPENLGMVATWNRCLDEAPTDLVNLLHADDALLPGYADLMLDLASRHPQAAAFFCKTEIMDELGDPRFSFADFVKRFLIPGDGDGLAEEIVLQGGESLRDLMAGYFIMTPTLCYRKSTLAGKRFSGRWKQVQDLVFTTDLLLEGHSLVGSRECAYAYRRHGASATSLQSDSMIRFDEEFDAFEEIAARADEMGWGEAARVARRKRIVKLHLLYRAMSELTRLRLGATTRTLRYLFSHS